MAVILAAQQGEQVEFFDLAFESFHLRGDFASGRLVIFHLEQAEPFGALFRLGNQLLVGFDAPAQTRHLLHHRLGMRRVRPEVGAFGGAFQPSQFRLQPLDVKDAPRSPSGVGEPPAASHSHSASPA
jgi:hypothetical protein